MCGILDDILPVAGAVLGSFIPGIGTAAGAALGGTIGGATSGWVQNHNLTGTLEGAASGGVGGYFGGGSIANALTNAGLSTGATDAAFDTGIASATPVTTGGLETSTGGASLFGPTSGTGTAIGNAASSLGGSNLGIAGGNALSGVGSEGASFLGGLGGGTQGTGLGVGTQTGSTADLAGVIGQTGSPTASSLSGSVPGVSGSPVSNLSSTQAGQGITGPTSTSAPVSSSFEGTQAPAPGGNTAAPSIGGGGTGLESSQAMAPGGGAPNLAAMYGPDSTAAGSPVGQGIAGAEAPYSNNVQFGALGEGTSSAPGVAGNLTQGNGMDLSSLFGGGGSAGPSTDIPGQSIGANYASAANSTDQGGGFLSALGNLFGGGTGTASGGGGIGQLSPWLGLAKAGLGAYQQYAQQQAQNAYKNQIGNIFSPNGAYAQQMQSNIARQYAAMGRNAEVGPQQVQLAAALAQAQAQALGGANYGRAALTTPGASMLNSLFSTAVNPQYAPGLANLGSSAWNGLQNLFG